MGEVWSAVHLTLGHSVAIKFLHRLAASGTQERLRFDREAKLAARLGQSSRHIARVIDHGVVGEDAPYLVMELLEGETLSERLARSKRLTIEFAARVCWQLCRALQPAHAMGVIHRDLKPANIFLVRAEEHDELIVKLLDFGVAKARFENEENETTRAGTLVGTPSYMSPEQIRADSQLDARADLWAVAAIVYRMVVGRTPFTAGPIEELAARIVSMPHAVPSSICPDLPPELDAWMARGLAKHRDARFQSAKELSESLAVIAGVTGGSSMFTTSGMRLSVSELPPQPPSPAGRVPAEQPMFAEQTVAESQAGVAGPQASAPPRKMTWPLLAAVVVLTIATGAFVERLVRRPESARQIGGRGGPEPTATVSGGAPAIAPVVAPAVASPSGVEVASTPSAPPAKSVASAKTAPAPSPPVGAASAAVATTSATKTTAAAPTNPSASAVIKESSDLWKKKNEL